MKLKLIFQNRVDDLKDWKGKTTPNMSRGMLNEKVRLMLLKTDGELKLDVLSFDLNTMR